jgi:hypothetical protein
MKNKNKNSKKGGTAHPPRHVLDNKGFICNTSGPPQIGNSSLALFFLSSPMIAIITMVLLHFNGPNFAWVAMIIYLVPLLFGYYVGKSSKKFSKGNFSNNPTDLPAPIAFGTTLYSAVFITSVTLIGLQEADLDIRENIANVGFFMILFGYDVVIKGLPSPFNKNDGPMYVGMTVAALIASVACYLLTSQLDFRKEWLFMNVNIENKCSPCNNAEILKDIRTQTDLIKDKTDTIGTNPI